VDSAYQRASKSSRISIGGTALAYTSWVVNVTGDDIVTNNFEDFDLATEQAYNEGILGFIGCAGDFGGNWDAHLNPEDLTGATPPGLYPRDDLTGVEFYTSIIDAITPWSFPFMRIRTSSTGADCSGANAVTFTCGYMNQGIFAFPSGSV